jgi:hypothetical protein
MNMTKLICAMALLALAPSAMAAPTSYVFDSISRIDFHISQPSVTGILQGASTPTTVSFNDQTNGDHRYGVSRCVPVFLTMLEKPGRYLLHLTVDPDQQFFAIVSCGLELRS